MNTRAHPAVTALVWPEQQTPGQLEHALLVALRNWAPTASLESVQTFAGTAAQVLEHVAHAHDSMVDLFGKLDDVIEPVEAESPRKCAELDAFTERRVA